MINDTDSFPLKWPHYRARTEDGKRKRAAFKTTPGKARDGLMDQLRMLGARDIIVSTNIHTYERGGRQVMYADQAASTKDPGVAVYYTWKGEQYVLACDKWDKVMDNLQALNKTVEAIRGIERWGSGDMLKAAFAGFKELPDPNAKRWWDVLGTDADATEAQIKQAYKSKAWDTHPDQGGSADLFAHVQNAYEQAMRQFKK
jgi:hypothetical protein